MWIWVFASLVLVAIFIGLGYGWSWTGFGETSYSKAKGDQEVQPKKTLWDWLALLIVPTVLALGGLWFAAQQDTRQQAIEDQRAKAEQRVEEQRAHDTALQAYLDQMSTLLLENDLRDSKVRTLARARTATVIQRLDSAHNANVMRFLDEAGLTGRGDSAVSLLAGANLRGADLHGVRLEEFNLSDTDLREADLTSTDLYRVDLSDADLFNADLSYAYLRDAKLGGANLRSANLSYAYLRGADGPTKEELEQQAGSLEGATMLNGQRQKSASEVEPDSVTASGHAKPAPDAGGNLVSYEPDKAVDGRADTAWNVPGSGVDESIMLEYDEPVTVNRIGVVPGYDKVDPVDRTFRFYQLYVISTAEIRFSDGSTVKANFARSPKIQFTDVPETQTNSITITIRDCYSRTLKRGPEGDTYSYKLNKAAISEIAVEEPRSP